MALMECPWVTAWLATKGVVVELAEAKRTPHLSGRPLVAVDVPGERAVLAEQELGTLALMWTERSRLPARPPESRPPVRSHAFYHGRRLGDM